MERHIRRIDGHLTRLHRLSNEELDNSIQHAYARLEQAQSDVDYLIFERHRRINQVLPFGEIAVQETIDYATANDGFASEEIE